MPNITNSRGIRKAKTQPKLGDTRAESEQTFVGMDHPLAAPRSGGWVLTRRLDAYNARGGTAACDYATEGSPELRWPDLRVIDGGHVACNFHGRVRSFGMFLLEDGLMTPTMARELESLMAGQCQPVR
jgi:hypothetical protein